MTAKHIRAEIVEVVPSARRDDVLYVSYVYRTAVHNCACGCGNKVVTPLSPAAWRLELTGSAPTLHPSIGNWGFPCRSHYLIEDGRIVWAADWTGDEVELGAERDREDRQRYFASRTPRARARNLIRRMLRLFR